MANLACLSSCSCNITALSPPLSAKFKFGGFGCAGDLRICWDLKNQQARALKRFCLTRSSGNGVSHIFDVDSRLQTSSTGLLELTTSESLRWRRVLLKVSGEALAGDSEHNVDPKITMSIAREVASIAHLGVEVAIVVGGGNFFRGSTWAGCSGLDRSSADHIGKLGCGDGNVDATF